MAVSEVAEKLREAGLRPPRMLTLAITGACNLRCVHCWVDAGVPDSSSHVPEARLRRVIGEFAALDGEGIRLTGGEPLCHPAWRDLLEFAGETGFRRIALQTNVMLLADEDVELLRDLDFPGLSIQVSMDGATAASHDLVRGPGSFSATVEGIRRLARAGLGPRISLFMTEMRHNLEELPALLEFADREGVGSFSAGTLVRCGRAGEEGGIAPPGPKQYRRLLERYDADPRFRKLYEKLGSVAILEWRTAEAESACGECCTFVENPYLSPGGRLYPCVLFHSDDFAVSGVFEKNLAAAFEEGIPLWVSLRQISRRRAEAIAKCRQCPEKSACAGGCLGRAWGSTGDLWAVDDRCDLRRALRLEKDQTA